MRQKLTGPPLIDLKQIDLPRIPFDFVEFPPETKVTRAYHLRGETFLWQNYERTYDQEADHSHCLCCNRTLCSPPLESLGLTAEELQWAWSQDPGEGICPDCSWEPFDGRLASLEAHYMAYATYDYDWTCRNCFKEIGPVLHFKKQIGDWDDEAMSLPLQLELRLSEE